MTKSSDSARRSRNLAFVMLLVCSLAAGVLMAIGNDEQNWILVALPAYLWWIRSDLALRGKAGLESWVLTFVSLLPTLGLLLYLLWTIRKASAVVLWIALSVALWLPGLMAYVLTQAVCTVVAGGQPM
ncbi:MAG: hypothetical protein RL398_2805 [Planctomycetota bacterium]|jgi:hypothetical protein